LEIFVAIVSNDWKFAKEVSRDVAAASRRDVAARGRIIEEMKDRAGAGGMDCQGLQRT
jgi:hypothetical protein